MKNYYVTVEHRVVISRKITVLTEACEGEGDAAKRAIEKENNPLISVSEDELIEDRKVRVIKVERC